ncbi:hypothetical protein PZ61_0236050 [Streptomyces sp. MNU77]|uniref:hypothetical protein n=1 Tax=Streptomyces sp. MNU77 TaxID=1573406 RepID=UPI0005E740FC|nr:hypothetical protein [Streptomyces sp. MNU77]OLO25841.1 hypothetical protein PZ61_0236050 [Streptomyces sp. MNU77]
MTSQVPGADSTAWPTRPTTDLLSRIRDARAWGVSWLTDQVADDGRPMGAETANSWWRAPWALCVGGAPDVAAAMMGWAEREALTDDGDLRPGPFSPPGDGSPVYHLSPLAIASWLLGRYDTASAVNSALVRFQDPETGGAYELRDFARDPLQDNLKTAQLGISSLVTGERHMADGVHRWLAHNLEDQPDLPHRLFTSRRGDKPVTDFTDQEAFFRVVDFRAPRQGYFHPGIAAAFFAGHAMRDGGDKRSVELARKYLSLTTAGTEQQFDDPSSVQICKFGWGAAAALAADPEGGHLPWVVRMGEWFVRRQRPDGAWAPSSFNTPDPGPLDLYWKTAEHVMEVSYIEQALAAHGVD